MAVHGMFRVCMIFFVVVIFVTFAFASTSASSSHENNYQILDVSASLKQALQVFSKTPNKQKAYSHPQQKDDANSFSVPLYSRPVHPSSYKNNYTALTLARLTRHEARLNSIFSGLSLTTPVQSAVPFGVGEYVADIGVGNLVKRYTFILDTGSDVPWLQCEPCSPCYSQMEPIYNPSDSTTYGKLYCSSPQCMAGGGAYCPIPIFFFFFIRCAYQVSYGDGSATSGDYATETFKFGDTSVADVAFGCGHDNTGLFQGVSGLLGLGGGPQSISTQLKATSFSYCLVNRDSSNSSTLDFNNTAPLDSVNTPLLNNPTSQFQTYRYIKLQGINVGGVRVDFSPSLLAMTPDGNGGVIVDSGTTITTFPTAVYRPLRAAFVNQTQNLQPTAGFSMLDSCYALSPGSRVKIPTVSFVFDIDQGQTLDLSPPAILIPVDNNGTYCFAFAQTDQSLSIIGNVQQQGLRVTYDLAGRKVGFSPNKC